MRSGIQTVVVNTPFSLPIVTPRVYSSKGPPREVGIISYGGLYFVSAVAICLFGATTERFVVKQMEKTFTIWLASSSFRVAHGSDA